MSKSTKLPILFFVVLVLAAVYFYLRDNSYSEHNPNQETKVTHSSTKVVDIAYIAPDDTRSNVNLLELLRDKNYLELNRLLALKQAAYESGKRDDIFPSRAFNVLANSDPAHEALLNEWVDQFPKLAIPYLARGMYYMRLGYASRGAKYASETSAEQLSALDGYHKKAFIDLRKAASLNPRLSTAYSGMINLTESAYTGASREDFLTVGLIYNPDSYAIRFTYLFKLMPRWGGSMEAIDYFTGEIRKLKEDYPAIQRLAGFKNYVIAFNLQQSGNYREAIKHYTKAMAYGEASWILYDRGIVYRQQKDYDSAIKDFNRAIELFPDNAPALVWRGITFMDAGMVDHALADFNAAARLHPYNFRALKNRAWLLAQREQYEAAILDYRASLYYEKNHADVWYLLGWYLIYKQQKYKEAADAFKNAVEMSPDNPLYWYGYADALNSSRDCEVMSVFKKYLAACEASTHEACKDENIKWAKETESFLLDKGKCP